MFQVSGQVGNFLTGPFLIMTNATIFLQWMSCIIHQSPYAKTHELLTTVMATFCNGYLARRRDLWHRKLVYHDMYPDFGGWRSQFWGGLPRGNKLVKRHSPNKHTAHASTRKTLYETVERDSNYLHFFNFKREVWITLSNTYLARIRRSFPIYCTWN